MGLRQAHVSAGGKQAQAKFLAVAIGQNQHLWRTRERFHATERCRFFFWSPITQQHHIWLVIERAVQRFFAGASRCYHFKLGIQFLSEIIEELFFIVSQQQPNGARTRAKHACGRGAYGWQMIAHNSINLPPFRQTAYSGKT